MHLIGTIYFLLLSLSIQVQADDFFYTIGLPKNVTSPTTERKSEGNVKVIDTLWYTSTRYTYVLDSSKQKPNSVDAALSANVYASSLPLKNVRSLYKNIKSAWVPGVTLMFDFPYPLYPDNMGIWTEVLPQIHSQLSYGQWKKLVPSKFQYIDNVLFANLKRQQIQHLHWVWKMLKLALKPGTAPDKDFPRLIFFEELEYMDQSLWTAFEHMVVPYARSGFLTPEIGKQFRAEAYALAGLPGVPLVPSKTITYMMAVGGDLVYNNDDVLDALQDIADFLEMRAKPASITPGAAFESFVSLMSKTAVLVTRHGPLLANSIFLPPGAIVLELLPYNWDWRSTGDMYFNVTRSLGDIHHFGWRADKARWAVYHGPEESKYADWTIEECSSSRQCLEVHARAGMIVDTGSVHEILMDTIPEVQRNRSVEQLKKPWPRGAVQNANTGLWMDIR